MRESDFIEWIRSRSSFDAAAVPVGPGDDAAVVTAAGRQFLITTDQSLDGVHFVYGRDPVHQIGRKAMARNLSDIAAMGGRPIAAVATVAVPPEVSEEDARGLYFGLTSLSEDFTCPLVGGDVAVWDGPLAITITIVGRPVGKGPVLRSGAKAGDAICVTGSFGGAWTYDRHLAFEPRIREAQTLAKTYAVHAMIDVSDGLGRDLAHITTASAVGAEIDAASVPIHPDLAGAPFREALDAALGHGEDYELLFTLAASKAEKLIRTQPFRPEVSRIGTIMTGRNLVLVQPDGTREPLRPSGWEHEG
jgi:thiamine-monophosphate kinase